MFDIEMTYWCSKDKAHRYRLLGSLNDAGCCFLLAMNRSLTRPLHDHLAGVPWDHCLLKILFISLDIK